MLSGHTDERWIVATRRWTLAAWMFLGFGQILGSHWAYVEVGWGGYYAWDPVENAALMPWLAATAFLHSVMIQERKGMLRIWNMVLVALAFELSIFGTFLTRSGVDQLDPLVREELDRRVVPRLRRRHGALLVCAHPLAAAAAARADEARVAALARGDVPLQQPAAGRALPDDPLGRDLPDPDRPLPGTQTRTIGRPYFDFFLRVFGLPLLLLMGIGPLIAWRRTSVRSLLKTLRWPIGAALVTGAVADRARRRLVDARA